jgi:hypothetical protein
MKKTGLLKRAFLSCGLGAAAASLTAFHFGKYTAGKKCRRRRGPPAPRKTLRDRRHGRKASGTALSRSASWTRRTSDRPAPQRLGALSRLTGIFAHGRRISPVRGGDRGFEPARPRIAGLVDGRREDVYLRVRRDPSLPFDTVGRIEVVRARLGPCTARRHGGVVNIISVRRNRFRTEPRTTAYGATGRFSLQPPPRREKGRSIT